MVTLAIISAILFAIYLYVMAKLHGVQPSISVQELEVYAKKCYNTTEEHKVNVSNLQSVDEVNNYDYKSGYPDKLIFSL